MNPSQPSIRVKVDPANPGQFFACCGLLETASRLWPGCCGHFGLDYFELSCVPEKSSLREIVLAINNAGLQAALTPELARERESLEARKRTFRKAGEKLSESEEDRRTELGKLLRSGAIRIGTPFDLTLDWWQSEWDNVPKTWAGPMEVRRIAAAALAECGNAIEHPRPFEFSCVLRPIDEGVDSNAIDEEGKAEPFYFDSTRGSNASPIDIGFSPNKLKMPKRTKGGKTRWVKMETAATPAVEFFALIGLQRFRPMPLVSDGFFEYATWAEPLPPSVAMAAVSGLMSGIGGVRYRFENAYRTDQRKHKGFRPATLAGEIR